MSGCRCLIHVEFALLFTSLAFGQTYEKALTGIGIDDWLPNEPIAVEAFLTPASDDATPTRFVRLLVPQAALETDSGEYSFDQLDARVDAYSDLGVSILIALWDPPSSLDHVEPWRLYVLSVAERYRGRVRGYFLGSGAENATLPDPEIYAYILKLTATQLSSADPEALIIEGHARIADVEWLESLYAEGVAPYLDAVSVTPAAQIDYSRLTEDLGKVQIVMSEADSTSRLLVTGIELGDDIAEGVRRLLVNEFINIEAGAALSTFAGAPEVVRPALSAANMLGDFLAGKVVSLDDETSSLRIKIEGIDQTEAVPHKLFFGVDTGSTYLAYWTQEERTYPSREVDVELKTFVPDAPQIRDPVSGAVETVEDFEWDEESFLSKTRVPLRDVPMLLVFPSAGVSTTVAAEGQMSVEEIVAQHQQVQASQDNSVQNYLAAAQTEIHFRPTASDSGFDVVTDNNFYFYRQGSEWEELSFSINGGRWGSDRPAFPLLQPEKVLSLPLNLQLNRDYVYRLEGQERIGDRLCYVVEFDPVDDERSLFQGKVWIDVENFARLKVQSVQTNLSPPVASSEETYLYTAMSEAGAKPVYLLSTLISRQLFLIAGRNILVERISRFSDFEINPPDFDARRKRAHSSENIMFRDTDVGLRYLVKRGGERVVSDKLTKTATAFAMGTIIDPAFDFPLPILGVSHLDFDFLERDVQFSLLFGGVLAFGNFQKSRVLGAPIDVSVDFSGIAIRGNDKVFNQGGEIDEARIKTRPLAVGVNIGWQFTNFQKIIGGYQVAYNEYTAAEETSEEFVIPTDTVTNGASLGYEVSRGGYRLSMSAQYAKRANWKPWGNVSFFDPETRSYLKYSATLAKDFFLSPFQKLHFDVGYFGGERLDRFTMYQPSLFDTTRIHGVPSAAVRFKELTLFRGSYGFNVMDQYRFDVFVDQGFGKDPTVGGNFSSVTGVGFGLSLRGPWDTLIRTDFGKSFLPGVYRGAGSIVAQILVLKPI
jgi:hypothetical protein